MSQAPIVVLRVQKSAEPVTIDVQRHSLADALKLRVADGMLTSVLAPNGDQITSVQLGMEVIQRSSLTVGLPRGGEIFSIFVNGESVNSIRLDRESEGGAIVGSFMFYQESMGEQLKQSSIRFAPMVSQVFG